MSFFITLALDKKKGCYGNWKNIFQFKQKIKYRIVDSKRITSAVIAISFLIGAGVFFILNNTIGLGIYLI